MAFTNVLRTELQDPSIKVLAHRPVVIATRFHEQRIGNDKGMYDHSMDGYEILVADDVAKAASWILYQVGRNSVEALDVFFTV